MHPSHEGVVAGCSVEVRSLGVVEALEVMFIVGPLGGAVTETDVVVATNESVGYDQFEIKFLRILTILAVATSSVIWVGYQDLRGVALEKALLFTYWLSIFAFTLPAVVDCPFASAGVPKTKILTTDVQSHKKNFTR